MSGAASIATGGGEAPGRARESLRSRALRASGWRLGAFALVKAIRLGSNIVLAALLAPAAFGIVTLAETIVRGLNMFSELGIGPAIIQSRHGDDERFLRTAWTMQVIRGFVLALATVLLAWPVAALYDEPALRLILPAIGITVLIQGFNSTSYFRLARSLSESRRALLELAQSVLTRGSMIAFAVFVVANEWALVIGTGIGALFFCLMSHLALPGIRHRFCWDRDAARELAHFGGWIFVGTVIAFFGQQADRLLLGKLDAMSVLGVYGIALTVSRLPQELSAVLSTHVLFPVLSEMHRGADGRFAWRVRRVRRVVLSAGLILSVCVVAAAPLFFELLYKPEYHAAAWIAPLASITAWIMLMNDGVNRALLAMGRTKELAASGLVRVLSTIAFSIAGYAIGDTPTHALVGFIIGVSLGNLCAHGVDQFNLRRHGVRLARQDLVFSGLVLVIGALVFAMDRTLAAVLDPGTGQVLARMGAGGAAAGIVALIFGRAIFRELRR